MKFKLFISRKILFTTFLILVSISIFPLIGKAQKATAKIILIRQGVVEGNAVRSSIFMNEQLLCQLNNEKYSTHEVDPGRYNFHAQWGGLNKRSDTRGDIEINVEGGKTYYIMLNIVVKSLSRYLGLIEVTELTFEKLKPSLKLDEKCF